MKLKEKGRIASELETLRQLLADLKESEIQRKQGKTALKALVSRLEKIEADLQSIEVKVEEDSSSQDRPLSLIPEDDRDSIRDIDLSVNSDILYVIDNLPFCVLLVDENHTILATNKAIEHEFGVNPQDIVGKYYQKMIHGVGGSFSDCPLEEAVDKDQTVENEVFNHHSGHWINEAIYPTGLRTKDGKKIYLYVSIDITEKKEAEEELLSNYRNQVVLSELLHISLINASIKEQLTLILEELTSIPWLELQAKGSIFLVEKDQEVLRMEANIGLDEELQKTCAKVPFGKCLCGQAAKSGKIVFADCIDKRHENKTINMLPHGHYCVPMIYDDIVLGVLNLYIDQGHVHDERDEEFLLAAADVLAGIIRRKQSEKKLRESEELYRNLIEMDPDVIATVDTKGIVTSCNKVAVELIGRPKEEIIGKHFTKIGAFYPGEIPKYMKIFASIIQGSVPETMEIDYQAHNGKNSRLEVRFSPIREKEKVTGFQAIARDITDGREAERKLKQNFEQLQKSLKGTVNALASVVETKDPYTAGHQRRVAELASAIANEMNFSEKEVEGINLAGLIHDIGKIYVAAEILSKPGPITEAEFNMIKSHPRIAHDILKTIDFPWPIADIVLQHHERMDGSGYPSGLSGDEILFSARILAVADVVEAMVSHRPYRPAPGLGAALEEIRKNRGTLYDAKVVDVCLKMFKKKHYKLLTEID